MKIQLAQVHSMVFHPVVFAWFGAIAALICVVVPAQIIASIQYMRHKRDIGPVRKTTKILFVISWILVFADVVLNIAVGYI